MTTEEFSNAFDTLLNSYRLNSDFGEQTAKQDIVLDEYEKSVFLTQAQHDLVLSYYNGHNNEGKSFEKTEELRRYLANLVSDDMIDPMAEDDESYYRISNHSKYFYLPDDLWFITYEAIQVKSNDCHNGQFIDTIPVTQDEYSRIKDNPFRGANDRRALRLDMGEGNVEIVSTYSDYTYYIRYITKLNPIILTDLPDDLSIDGENTKQECQLHEALHQEILQRAVLAAIRSKQTVSPAQQRQ